MAEYIEREKVCETLDTALNETYKLNGLFSQYYIRGCRNTLRIAINDIQKIPAADVRPERHGRWIFDSDDEYVIRYHCNKCGTEIDLCNEIYTEPKPNYCNIHGNRELLKGNDEQ